MPHRFHGVSLQAYLSEFSLKAGEHFPLVPAFLWPFAEAFGKHGAIELEVLFSPSCNIISSFEDPFHIFIAPLFS